MRKVALHNLGCKVNSYELDVMQQLLEQKGYEIVPFDEMADIYIVNTCTVTNIADRKSRQMLHRAKQKNPEAVVVAVGCYVQTGLDNVEKDDCIDLAVGNNRKKDIVEILDEYFKSGEKTLHSTTVPDLSGPAPYEEMTLEKTAEHTRAYIKIQDGCNQFCTYCAIPLARGRIRSRKPEDIVREITGIVKAGYKEIVLTGIHISSYGLETGQFYDGQSQLVDLVEEIAKIKGLERIRLSSLEPRVVTPEVAKRLAAIPKVCPHFHLSLQSGCDSVLKRMNRQYTTEQFYESVQALRTAFDHPAITTDVIVGFPGETEEEFAITKEFLKKIEFYEMHIFKFSKRKGTVAAGMPGQLTEAVKAARSDELFEIEAGQSLRFRQSHLGKNVKVLWEEVKKLKNMKADESENNEAQEYLCGHTPDYVMIAILKEVAEAQKIQPGEITEVKALHMLNDEIVLGEV